MSFDGAIEDLIVAWATTNLPPRKRRQDSISIDVVPMDGDGELLVLYSYAEAIAAMYVTGRRYYGRAYARRVRFAVVKAGREALGRASLTTQKHLRWTQSVLREELTDDLPHRGRLEPTLEPIRHLVFLYRGNIPDDPVSWFKFGNYMAVVRDSPSSTLRALWKAYEREPWEETTWHVLADAYLDIGFETPTIRFTENVSGFELRDQPEDKFPEAIALGATAVVR
jgi:hypothetical protein